METAVLKTLPPLVMISWLKPPRLPTVSVFAFDHTPPPVTVTTFLLLAMGLPMIAAPVPTTRPPSEIVNWLYPFTEPMVVAPLFVKVDPAPVTTTRFERLVPRADTMRPDAVTFPPLVTK